MSKTSPSPTSQLPKHLPKPSDHGTYWLGKPTQAPAIFLSAKKDEKGRARWFASMGDLTEEFGVLLDAEGNFRYFYTPDEALKAMRDWIAPLSLRGD